MSQINSAVLFPKTNMTQPSNDNIDTHPALYRAASDGGIPSNGAPASYDANPEPLEPASAHPDLHPAEWKRQMDAQMPDIDWSLYPNVSRQFSDGVPLKMMSEAERAKVLDEMRVLEQQAKKGASDVYPNAQRAEANHAEE